MTCLGLSNYHLGLSMRYSQRGFAQPDTAWGRKSHTIVNSGKGIIGSMGSKLGKKDEITVIFFLESHHVGRNRKLSIYD